MIVKNLTRKSGVGQLVRYVLREPPDASRSQGKQGRTFREVLTSLNIKFTEKDLQYLEAESADKELLERYEVYGYNFKEFWVSELSKVYERPQLLLTHNILSTSVAGYIQEFSDTNASRHVKRKDMVEAHHTILSWSPRDSSKISNAMLRDMAKQFISSTVPNCKVIGTVHRECAHIHIHLVVSGTMLNGKSSRISKEEFQQAKIKLQQYQMERYPELSHSLPKHQEKSSERTKPDLAKNKFNERASVKTLLLECLDAIPKHSAQQLAADLQGHGFAFYERDGRIAGLQHANGLKFRFSRLGVDIDVLLENDRKKAIQKKELQALNDLRERKYFEARRDLLRESTPKDRNLDESTMQQLSELYSIRDNANERSADLGRQIEEQHEDEAHNVAEDEDDTNQPSDDSETEPEEP